MPPQSVPVRDAGATFPNASTTPPKQAFTDFESMLADIANADVVFVGEQHDDPNTHRLEAAMLDGLRRRGVPVTLSLEMFERDTQAGVDTYLSAGIARTSFSRHLARGLATRPTTGRWLSWRKHNGWPVIAANVPRRYRVERRQVWPDGARHAYADRAVMGGRRPAMSRRTRTSIASPETMTDHDGPGGGTKTNAPRKTAQYDRALLLLAVRQGRDDGRRDCHRVRPVQSASSSSTSTGRSTATSARGLSSACGGG